MKFKRAENNMIWESYGNPKNYTDAYPDDEEFGDFGEDAEAVISLEPMGELDVESVPEEDGLFDVEEIPEDEGLDNEIIIKSLRKIVKRAGILLQHCEAQSMETWMIAKIIKAEDYISDVWEELDDVADFANDGPEEEDVALTL